MLVCELIPGCENLERLTVGEHAGWLSGKFETAGPAI
jgi:hypothetical protein